MRKFLFSSLWVKLIVGYSIVVALTLFTFSFWVFTETRDWFFKQVDTSLIKSSEIIDNYLSMKLGDLSDDFDVRRLDTILDGNMMLEGTQENLEILSIVYKSLILNPEKYYVQVLDINQNPIWKSKNLQENLLPTFPDSQYIKDLKTYAEEIYKYDTVPRFVFRRNLKGIAGDSVFINIPYDNSDLRLYILKTGNHTISIGYGMSYINYVLKRFLRYFYIGIPIAIFLIIALLLAIGKIAYQPIEKISTSIDNINPLTLKVNLPYSEGDPEFGRLSSSLQELMDKVADRMDKSYQFASDASHELKTPLTILRGELELALNNNKTEEQYQELIAGSLDEVIRLTNVVNTLLELSRAERGQIKMNLKDTNISGLLDEIIQDIEILADDKNIKVQSQIEPSVSLNIDNERIHQALLNILDNSVKYTPDGGTINISLKRESNFTIICFEDSGIGIPPEQLPSIFDRFYRSSQVSDSKISGNGLGLSIAKWIIDAHCGIIEVESTCGVGTKFTIKLPELNI